MRFSSREQRQCLCGAGQWCSGRSSTTRGSGGWDFVRVLDDLAGLYGITLGKLHVRDD